MVLVPLNSRQYSHWQLAASALALTSCALRQKALCARHMLFWHSKLQYPCSLQLEHIWIFLSLLPHALHCPFIYLW